MKTLLKLLVSIVIALTLAFAAAWFMLREDRGNIHNGPWVADLSTGGEDAGFYRRARIAVYGIWALNSTETIYYVAKTDSAGFPLSQKCVYRIEGRDPQTRWWSIAAYNNYHFIPNEVNRYSFSKTTVGRNQDGSWQIRLSPEKEELNWLPSGKEAGEMGLLLRVYNPSPEFAKNLAGVELPQIIREKCL